jgi:DNA-binding NarL/FixJ family response regulator
MMLERQREGIAKAKSAGKYKGRKPIDPERQEQVARLAAEGATKTSIARQLGMGEATVYRIPTVWTRLFAAPRAGQNAELVAISKLRVLRCTKHQSQSGVGTFSAEPMA